jgi:hypothetical protein
MRLGAPSARRVRTFRSPLQHPYPLRGCNSDLAQYSKTPRLQDSITPRLHHSKTPSLQDSITPSLHHSITPSLHHSITPRGRIRGREQPARRSFRFAGFKLQWLAKSGRRGQPVRRSFLSWSVGSSASERSRKNEAPCYHGKLIGPQAG